MSYNEPNESIEEFTEPVPAFLRISIWTVLLSAGTVALVILLALAY